MDEELNEATTTTEEPTSANLDDALRDALAGVGGSSVAGDEAAGSDQSGGDAQTEAAGKADGGERDPTTGRFVPRKAEGGDTEVKGVDSAEPATAAKSAADTQPKAADEPAEPAAQEQPQAPQSEIVDGRDIAKAPNSWKPGVASEFSKLPREVRAEIHRREEDLLNGFKKIEHIKGAADFGVTFARQIQPYKPLLDAAQIAPTDILHAALEFEKTMRTGTPEQVVATFKHLAKTYGLNLDNVKIEVTGPQVDPVVAELKQEVTGLKSKLTERERAEQEESQRAAALQEEVRAFRSDPANALYPLVQSDMLKALQAGEANDLRTAYDLAAKKLIDAFKPQAEFYGLVEQDVLKILASGQGADLKDAYDKAIWINPVTRAKLIARQQEAERKEAAEKAAAAEKANRVNVTPRATPQGKTAGKGTLDDALRSSLSEVMARSA